MHDSEQKHMLNLRFYIIMLLLIFWGSLHVKAQNEDGKVIDFFDRAWVELGFSSQSKYHEIKPYATNFNFGFDLTKRLYIFISDENYLGLLKKDNNRDYFKAYNFGGGIGFSFLKNTIDQTDKESSIDVKTSITTSLGNADWKNTAYSVGLYFRRGYSCTNIKPYIGIGYKFINSHAEDLSDHSSAFLTIGLRY